MKPVRQVAGKASLSGVSSVKAKSKKSVKKSAKIKVLHVAGSSIGN